MGKMFEFDRSDVLCSRHPRSDLLISRLTRIYSPGEIVFSFPVNWNRISGGEYFTPFSVN